MACSHNNIVPVQGQGGLVFNENTMLSRDTFPSKNDLTNFFNKEDFNRLLNTVKNNILQSKRMNTTSTRINIPDMINISPQIISDVKDFLRSKGYVITEVEDVGGISSGWRINF